MSRPTFQAAEDLRAGDCVALRPDGLVERARGVDVRVENHGSICLLRLNTDDAKNWVDTYVDAEAQWFGGALVVEPRYVADIVEGMRGDGLEVI